MYRSPALPSSESSAPRSQVLAPPPGVDLTAISAGVYKTINPRHSRHSSLTLCFDPLHHCTTHSLALRPTSTPPNAASCSTLGTNNNTRMPQPPAAPPLHPPNPPRSTSNMTETQKLPVFSSPGFLDYPHRRLPPPVQLKPLEIPLDAVPPRSDYPFRSPINQLPSIQPGPPRHDQHQHQPSSLSRPPAAPVEKLLHSNPYTPPRSDPPYSPQQYGPSISPRSEFDSRGPRRLTEQRYPYEDSRPVHHPPHHEQSYSSLASPVEPSQQRGYAPIPSPGYTPSYASSNTPFRGSVGSRSHSHRGSVPNSLGPLTYPEPPTAGPPPRQEPRAVPLPGSVPQPVYNEQL